MPTRLSDALDEEKARAAQAQAAADVKEPIQEERVQTAYRSQELEWRRTHREVLRTFAGEWVVLEGEAIIAHGSDPVQVVAAARAKGIKVPYLFYVEAMGEAEDERFWDSELGQYISAEADASASIEEVRKALSVIPGSLAAEISQERDER